MRSAERGCFARATGPRRLLPAMAGLLLLATICSAPVTAQEPDAALAAANRAYRVAYGFQKKRLYEQAAQRWTAFLKAYPKHERIANAQYHLAVCQFQDQQFPAAAEGFRKVLASYPKFASRDGAQFNLGLVQYNIALESQKPEDFRSAAKTFAVLPAQHAKSGYVADALYYQAESLTLAGDREQAIPVYQKVVKEHAQSPLLPDVLYAMGTTQQDLQKLEEAAATYADLLKRFPQSPQFNEVQLRLGLVQLGLKKYPEAEKLLKASSEIKDFSFADYALLQYGNALYEQEKNSEAATLYESIRTKFPESAYISTAMLAGGKSRYRNDQFAEAAAALTVVVQQKAEESPEAAYWLGRTLIRQEKYPEAEQALTTAVAAYPQSGFLPQLSLARIDARYEQPEKRKATIAEYAQFAGKFAKDPLAAEALYMAAVAAINEQDYKAAQQHADAFTTDPARAEHERAGDALFLAGEGYLLDEPSRLEDAEKRYRQLVSQHPEHDRAAPAQVRIGLCLYRGEKYDPAVAHLTQASGKLKEPELLAEARLLIGRSHHDAGRPKDAVPALRSSLQAHPKWERGDEVLSALAASLQASEDLDGARAELQKLIAGYPESELRQQAQFQVGRIAMTQEKFDDAEKAFRQVVTIAPEHEIAPLAWHEIANARFAKDDFAGAVNELNQLLQKHPQHEIAGHGYYLRGLSHQRLEKFPEAVADLNRYLAGKPMGDDVFDARFALGLAQAGQKQYPQAVATLAALIKDKPDYAQADRAHYEMAFAYLENKQGDKAAETFQALATKYPESPLAAESLFRVGEFHETAEDLPKAEQAYAAGLKLAKAPELRERLHYKLGWVHYTAGKFAEAGEVFQAQVKEFPEGALLQDANYLAGESLHRQNKFAEALPWFAKVISAGSEKYQPRALYRSGDCAAAVKNWPVSQKSYAELIQKFPKFAQINEARYGLGLALQNQNKLEEAGKVYEEVTKQTASETAAKSRFMLGEIAFAQKKFDEAVGHFIEVTEGYPAKEPYTQWQAMGYFEMGRCFLELEDAARAREALTTLTKKFPDHARVKDATALLAKIDSQ